ncbi:C6 transcription [Pleurostoma richardsiae]|uniref:C6 transcription n=1 Tax=Pleurostoma richardsiae TaxID=41990 RepID=A0AA38R908_9PEZI|nr:C6 transcription [Pleurostoma richardsiae]
MFRTSHTAGGMIVDLQASPASHTVTSKYRRNGKLQSCEPCRRSKLRCDHTVPVCQRCIKRRRTDECVYHPHPLTQSPRHRSPAIPTPSASSATHDSPQAPVQSIEPVLTEWHVASVPTLPLQLHHDAAGPIHVHRAASAPPLEYARESGARVNPGFVGDTSYSSIFSEGLGNLELAGIDLEAPPAQAMTISNERIVRGCQTLFFLKDRHMVNRFVSRFYEINEDTGGMGGQLMIKEWLQKLWIQHGDVLVGQTCLSGHLPGHQDPQKIRRLSELIWRNTQKPLAFDGKTTAMEWLALGTGPNIRWEVIGLIAAEIGMCATCLDPSEPFFTEHKVTRHVLSRKMLEISQTCLSFCRECEMLDDMFIWLLLENACLHRAVKGDRSYGAYRATGEVNDAVISMGLHQGSKPSCKVPFFLAELRNKAFLAAYIMEVGLATFLGRPPRLSHRYSSLELPKDLSESQLFLEGPELEAAIAELDENGYSKVGKVHRMTWMRSCAGYAPRREDILDLALGNYTSEEILQRADMIHAKMNEHWATLPPFIAKARYEDVDFAKMPPLEMLLRSAVRQGARANELLLQRVLIRKTGASPEKLISTAREIFRDILQITQRHDITSMFHVDFTSLLVAHGLRSGAIIAVELLKQELLPVYPERPLLPKSQTIQDLSVFAARLGAVDPTDGSFSMCEQGRKVITRILDKILTPTPAGQHHPACCRQSQPPQEQSHGARQMDIDDPTSGAAMDTNFAAQDVSAAVLGDFGVPLQAPLTLGHDYDFMQWLDSVDWQQADTWNY